MIGIRCAALSQAMINRPRNGKGKKRPKPRRTAVSDQDDAGGLDKKSSNGGLEGGTCADIEPSGYASTVVRQKELQEIVSTLKLVQYGPPSAPPLTISL